MRHLATYYESAGGFLLRCSRAVAAQVEAAAEFQEAHAGYRQLLRGISNQAGAIDTIGGQMMAEPSGRLGTPTPYLPRTTPQELA